MEAFLRADRYVDWQSPIIREKAAELFTPEMTEVERTKAVYEFVRDRIPHSFDCDAVTITARAYDVLGWGAGICHAKANLLAALLRAQGISAGFCFQHISLMDDASRGYCVHAFNAVFLLGR